MNVQGPTTEKWQLPCCALAQLTCEDDTSIQELQWQINRMKEEAKELWHPKTRRSGERSCFAIATPNEHNLKHNLIKLGFQKIWEFPRRNGYPPVGNLEMYALKW